MKCSICLSTFAKPRYLERVLESIICQRPPFSYEVIVVDDGSPTEATREVCSKFLNVWYVRISRAPAYRNPAIARNIAYRLAQSEVVICQSDDVEHVGEDTIEKLTLEIRPGAFLVATVINTDWEGNPKPCKHPNNPTLVNLTGLKNPRPIFFLGSVRREDLYAVGGCEEKFTAPGRDDIYLADCLMKGRGLRPRFLNDVVGHHLHHPRPPGIRADCLPSREVYRQLAAEGQWVASGGPWPFL